MKLERINTAKDFCAKRSQCIPELHRNTHFVALICIQESNLNSSSSFWIPGFFALRSDHTHSRSGIFSRDTTHASGDVIILVRQSLTFSELSTYFFLRLISALIL